MHIVRTVVWVLLLVALTAFSVANWDPVVPVRIWENLIVDTKIPAIVVVSFLIGFVPMWLLYRATKWKLQRRIGSLETTARTAAHIPLAGTAEPHPPVYADAAPPSAAAPVEPARPAVAPAAEHPMASGPRVDQHNPPHVS